MITLSAYVGDGIHEKEIDAQNAKMSGLKQQKEENMGCVSSVTSVCVSYFNFFFTLPKERSFLFCMKVFCTSPRNPSLLWLFKAFLLIWGLKAANQ